MRRPTGRSRRFPARRVASGPAPFSPADIAGLEAWYRETYAAGTWSDKSGNGRNLTQATAANRPTQTTRAGQAVLSLDGGDLVQGPFGSLLPQPLTIYCVAEVTDTAVARSVYDGDDATNRCNLLAQTTVIQAFAGGTLRAFGTLATGAIRASCVTYNGAGSNGFYNDFRDSADGISASPGTAGLDGFTVGGTSGGAQPFLGYVWEIIIYSGAHDAATRKLIGDYFTARYTGLTVTT